MADTDDTSNDETGGDATDDTSNEDTSTGTDDTSDGDAKVEFTAAQQAHIDKLINEARGKAKGQATAEVKKYLEREGMAEADKIKAERDDAIAKAEAADERILTSQVEVAAERAALAAGVRPDRSAKFLRLLDLAADDLRDDGKPATDAIKAAVEKELADAPEFKGKAAPAGSSGSDNLNGDGGAKTWTRAEITAMSDEEFEKNKDDILAATAAGSVK